MSALENEWQIVSGKDGNKRSKRYNKRVSQSQPLPQPQSRSRPELPVVPIGGMERIPQRQQQQQQFQGPRKTQFGPRRPIRPRNQVVPVARPANTSTWGSDKSGFWTKVERTAFQKEQDEKMLVEKEEAAYRLQTEKDCEYLNGGLFPFWKHFEYELVHYCMGKDEFPEFDYPDELFAPCFTKEVKKGSTKREYYALNPHPCERQRPLHIKITPDPTCAYPSDPQTPRILFQGFIEYKLSLLGAFSREKCYENFEAFFADVDNVCNAAWDI